jgi:SAM-dependent methyltransferase
VDIEPVKLAMIPLDLDYIRRAAEAGLISSPCLELGAAEYGDEVNGTAVKTLLGSLNIQHETTDTHGQVDYIANFDLDVHFDQQFGSVIACNILEHVFDPIRLLDKIVPLVRKGGTCVLTTPVVWPLHYYPLDCWRINPGFYMEYAKRNELELKMMEYLGYGEVIGSEPSLPVAQNLWSRGIHKLFNTRGRGMLHPSHVSIGVVLKKP